MLSLRAFAEDPDDPVTTAQRHLVACVHLAPAFLPAWRAASARSTLTIMPAPARPRDAATLILVRQDGELPRILMGRRAAGHDFMPDKWVFPGGRIDRADYSAPSMHDLQPDVAAALAATARRRRQDGGRLARALAQTAVRETYEETGLIVGTLAGDRLVADLGGLAYVARAITPPARHKRFDARFLLGDAEALASLEPADSRELGEVAWFTVPQCRALDLPLITRAVLDVVSGRLRDGAGDIPFWRWTRGSAGSAL